MVAYDHRIGAPRNIAALDTDMSQAVVFDTNLGDIETELLARELLERRARKANLSPARAPRRARGRGLMIAAFLAAFALGTGLFAAAFLMLGGAALLGALLLTVPMVDVVGPAPAASLPGGADAELVIMPDPGFRPK